MLLRIIICLLFSTPIIFSQHNFITKFEASNYLETSRYDESIEYFKQLDLASEYAKLIEIGLSPQGRQMYCLVVSKDKAFTSDEAKRSGNPIILIINGIHSGEIEGKDASMLMLREMLITKEKEYLLSNVTLLVIPVFSVDGHERFRANNRINQNGPLEMGWRTTSQNLNLNRDWMKADAPEMQNMLRLYNSWLPDFLIDNHTTDGSDHQYLISYGIERFQNIYSETAKWLENKFIVDVKTKLEAKNILVAPYVGLRNDSLEKGISEWAGTPRFSQGYAAAHNRPGLLVETHSLKPYKDRVFATKYINEYSIEYIAKNGKELLALNKSADENTLSSYTKNSENMPIQFESDKNHSPFVWKGIKYNEEISIISGKKKIVYTGEKIDINVPHFNKINVSDHVKVPKGYLIPEQYKEIVERLKLHNIKVTQLEKNAKYNIIKTKFKDVKFAQYPYEGRQRVNYSTEEKEEEVVVPKGTYIVDINQRNIKVLLYLLEPKSDDSFVKWGFFNSVFEQKEYFEDYMMEKIALEMYTKNVTLRKEFEEKLKDENFKNNPNARLNFFYERSPYYDEQFMIYPIMKIN